MWKCFRNVEVGKSSLSDLSVEGHTLLSGRAICALTVPSPCCSPFLVQSCTLFLCSVSVVCCCSAVVDITLWIEGSMLSCDRRSHGPVRTSFHSGFHEMPCWPEECSHNGLSLNPAFRGLSFTPFDYSRCLSSLMRGRCCSFWRFCWKPPTLVCSPLLGF